MTVQINTFCKVIAWLFFSHGKTPDLGLILNLSNEVSVAGEEQPAGLSFWTVIETNQDDDWSKVIEWYHSQQCWNHCISVFFIAPESTRTDSWRDLGSWTITVNFIFLSSFPAYKLNYAYILTDFFFFTSMGKKNVLALSELVYTLFYTQKFVASFTKVTLYVPK